MNKSLPLILIAEDQADLRQNLVEFLTLENYRVLAAEDGKTAYALAVEHVPHLIISDVAMPCWDGPRLLAELRNNPATADIPLLFLSAWANRDHVRRGMQLGAVDYITKPFSLAEITGTIQVQLEKRDGLDRRICETRKQERAKLMSVLPHELLTPLNAIVGPAEILSTANDAMGMAEVRKWAGLIAENANGLSRMIEKVLIYLELNKLASEAPTCRPADAGEQHGVLLGAMQDVAPGRFVSREPATVRGRLRATKVPDHALRRLLMELFDNAYRFSPEGSAVIVDIVAGPEGDTVRIANQGSGLTDDVFRRLTEIGPESLAPGGKESGAGLAIATGLLKLYGARLSFDTSGQSALTVVVFLPIG